MDGTSGGNGSPGPSSYGSSGCVVCLRAFFFVRLCVFFVGVGGFAAVSTGAASAGSAATGAASAGTGGTAGAASTGTGAAVADALDADVDGFADPVDEPEPALFVDDDVPDRPSASRYAPAPASARSTSSTAMMRPMRRFGGGWIESSVSRGRRCCDVGFMLWAGADVAPFFECAGAGVGIGCAACGLLGARCTLGVSGYDAGGTERGS